jgi:glucose/arabinose dehydrogenase
MKKMLPFLLFLCSFSVVAQTINLETFASGFSSPVAIVNAGDARLFVVQRGGAIRILNANGTINTTNFLTLTSATISSGGERGLLGLAFHPNYATNGYFYVNYTRTGDGATVIARYSVSSTNPNVADASSALVLLTIAQPFSNHNGGSLVFGPDGFLYIGMGDGGSANDPNNSGQNINTLLGKMLRIDVNSGTLYGIPPTNPFAGATAGADEIWAVGMRNPWKFSFDSQTGDLWIADVGQNAIEEINKAPSTAAGLNYGWRCYEGNSPFNTTGCSIITNYVFPVTDYTHAASGGCSITGGYVYRGATYPNLQGKYVFSDYCNNKIGYISNTGGAITWSTAFSGNISTFGEDVNGELYVAGITNGVVSKITDTTLSVGDFDQIGISIYPNPAKDYFTIENKNKHELSIKIYDASGKLIVSQNGQSLETVTINTSGFSRGLYLLVAEDVNGYSFKSKVMIQ